MICRICNQPVKRGQKFKWNNGKVHLSCWRDKGEITDRERLKCVLKFGFFRKLSVSAYSDYEHIPITLAMLDKQVRKERA